MFDTSMVDCQKCKKKKNQWTGFYKIGTSVMKELNVFAKKQLKMFTLVLTNIKF